MSKQTVKRVNNTVKEEATYIERPLTILAPKKVEEYRVKPMDYKAYNYVNKVYGLSKSTSEVYGFFAYWLLPFDEDDINTYKNGVKFVELHTLKGTYKVPTVEFSVKQVSEVLGLSLTTTKNSMRELREKGFLGTIETIAQEGGTGRNKLYISNYKTGALEYTTYNPYNTDTEFSVDNAILDDLGVF